MQEGRLKRGDSLAEALPASRDRIDDADSITVEHLLRETSALPDSTDGWLFRGENAFNPERGWSFESLFDLISLSGTDAPPGTDYSASAANYLLLGRIAELASGADASGRDLADLYAERIFARLPSAKACYIQCAETELAPGHAEPFLNFVPGAGPQEWSADDVAWASALRGAGGLAMNARTLTLFYQRIFRGDGGGIISDSALAAMQDMVPASDASNPDLNGYGLGLQRLERNGRRGFGHTGAIPGYRSAALHIPAGPRTIAVLCNSDACAPLDLVWQLDADFTRRLAQ